MRSGASGRDRFADHPIQDHRGRGHDRHDRRNERSDRSMRKRAPQKPLPPTKTHAEEFYYQKQMQAKTPMIVVMDDGERFEGWIEWYDEDCIKVHRHNGANLLIYKTHVRYLYKDEAQYN